MQARTAPTTAPVRFVPLPREILKILGLWSNFCGPILIRGSAPENLLLMKELGNSLDGKYTISAVQYAVLTRTPIDWDSGKNCMGIFPSYDERSRSMLDNLAAFANSHAGEKEAVILLVDEFELITTMESDARNNLRWLLANGPGRRVWPIIAASKTVDISWANLLPNVIDKN